MAVLKCKMCGGTLEFAPGATVGECDSCGSKQTLPKMDDDRLANLYDRANHFRRNNDYDKAMKIYEDILKEDKTDAEAYWSIILCRYGIEYVEDPETHKRVPTVNRAQYVSIYEDEDYKSALRYADTLQKVLYEEEAAAINEIQKGILEISQKEEPFDVFICYKETDAGGRRTPDSVLANDLYHQLTNEGFRVFFSRITLEDKIGTAYEPYIFAALNSAKVMVALGTKPEYFQAAWVKNEWSRYLALVKRSEGKKVLIPAYRDMDPYDMPDEFSHLQAQDMSKLGFMQDLIRGIKKIAGNDAAAAADVKETIIVNGAAGQTDIAPLLKRAFMYLEDREWKQANDYFDRILDIDPENGDGYLGKLLAEMKIEKMEGLALAGKGFANSKNYQRAVQFGKEELIDLNREAIYHAASEKMKSAEKEGDYLVACEMFGEIAGYQDADAKRKECQELADADRKQKKYDEACDLMSKKEISAVERAKELFIEIAGWKDSEECIQKCEARIQRLREAQQREKEEKKKREKQKRIEESIVELDELFGKKKGEYVLFFIEAVCFSIIGIVCICCGETAFGIAALSAGIICGIICFLFGKSRRDLRKQISKLQEELERMDRKGSN